MKGQKTLFSSASDEWATPQKLFDELNAEFEFTLDSCATSENAKCKKFYTINDDGLKQSWDGERVFVNPPYSNVSEWVRKAETSLHHICVMLIPARVDTRWFHSHIWDGTKNRTKSGVEIRFIKGRLKFGDAKNSAPFPSMIVIFR
jgi:phage N-6-adenine-methyltransferase